MGWRIHSNQGGPWRTREAEPTEAGSILAACLALAAAAALCYWPLISRQWSLSGDYASYYYPFAQFLARALSQGELPLWNPFLAAGYHHLANPQTQVLYPPAWLLALFVQDGRLPYYAVELFTLAHYPLAGIFLFLYLRRLGAPGPAAMVSALAFICLGFMWAQMMHKAMVETAAWLPVLLFALQGLLDRPDLRRALFAGLAGAMMFLAGFAPLVYLAAPFLLAYCLAGLGGGGAGPGRRACFLALAGALALGLAAVQLAASLELSRLTYRHDFDLATAAEISLRPASLLTALAPLAFLGDGSHSFEELHFHLGVAPLLLAGLAWGRPGQRRAWFWAGAAAAALVLALGENTPLYGFLWKHLPGMNVTRAPGRYLLIVDLGLAVLAGLGAARLMARGSNGPAVSPWLLGLYLALGLAGLGLRWHMERAGWDPQTWGMTPDLAGQVTRGLCFWFAGLSLLALGLVRRFPRGLIVAAMAVLALVEALIFNRALMWDPRPPETYFPVTDNVAFLRGGLPPGRLGMERQVAYAYRDERNAGAVYFLPTTAVFDTMGEARLWRFMGLDDPRLTADLLGERYYSTHHPVHRLPQAKYRPFEVWPGQPAALDLAGLGPGQAKELGLISSLAYAEAAVLGEEVAEVALWSGGRVRQRLLVRAGQESAEWSVANPRRTMNHGPAAIARSWAVEGEGYLGHAYVANWTLEDPLAVERIEVRGLHPNAVIRVEALTLDGVDILGLGRRYQEEGPSLHRNLYAQPRARLLGDWRLAGSEGDALRAVRVAPLEREVVLEKEPRFAPALEEVRPDQVEGVEVMEEGLTWVRLRVRAAAPSILFLADTYYPGWRAEADGRPVEVLRANYAFRAVALGPGEHLVAFFYRPAWWPWAVGVNLISLAAWLGLGCAVLLGRGDRRRWPR